VLDLDVLPALNRERLYQQVADHIEGLVDSGRLQPGDRLPPERELAETLHVGRGVIREAVKVLNTRGLVTVKPGLGTYVSEIDADYIAGHLGRYLRMSNQSLNDLNEIRQILEVEIATFAARRATPEDLEQMRRALAEMDEPDVTAESYVQADQAFHLALARAARNELFPLLLEVIADRLAALRLMNFRVPGAPQRGQSFHRQIVAAIENRDPAHARQSMRDHMKQVAEDLQSA
jgi:GntR family transcriptional regulator, transcriptional repressor for pyruvate dehydrogenase complex